MNKDKLVGIIVGLLIASSIIYTHEGLEHFENNEYLVTVFFTVTIGTILFAAIALTLNKFKIIQPIILFGTTFLFLLYFFTRETIEDIGELGLIVKIIQAGIIAGIILLMRK